MKATVGLAVPAEALVEIRVWMTVAEAKRLHDQLVSAHPSWVFGDVLQKGIERAMAHVEATDEVER